MQRVQKLWIEQPPKRKRKQQLHLPRYVNKNIEVVSGRAESKGAHHETSEGLSKAKLPPCLFFDAVLHQE